MLQDIPLYLSFILLAFGFILLIKGADWLVTGASSLGKRFYISDLAIGLTVVAFGTSAPELVVSVISSLTDKSSVVTGNVIGSNIFNLLMILGISGIIYPLAVKKNTKWREIPYSLLGVFLLLILANDKAVFFGHGNYIGFWDGLILFGFFLLFIYYIYNNIKKDQAENAENQQMFAIMGTRKTTILIVFGLIGLVIGGHTVVDMAVNIAHEYGMSEKMIGLTIIAAGTSLPELATSAVAAFKKETDIAIGNIIGSNIFNIFLVLGVSAMIAPIEFELVLNWDLGVVAVATLFLFSTLYLGQKNKVDRWEAVIFLLLFAGYFTYVFIRN